MTIDDFEDSIDEFQLAKGFDYFENGQVVDLEEYSPGSWQATVEGNELYEVEIRLRKNVISDCSCDCPHDAEYCKHIIAVLYALQEEKASLALKKGNSTIGKTRKTQEKNDVKELVTKIPEKDLRKFVIDLAVSHPEISSLLIARFSANYSADTHLYAKVIRDSVDMLSDRHGFIDYRNVNKAIKPVYTLLENAAEAFAAGNYAVTADIAIAVIEQMHELLTTMDDSSGIAGDSIREAFGLLGKLCETDIPVSLKERLFTTAEKASQDPQYNFVGFDEYWLNILTRSAFDQSKQQHLLKTFDVMLSKLSKQPDGWSYEYNLTRLLQQKLSVMRSLRLYEEAATLCLQYLHLPALRLELIEETLQKKEYDTAKQLIEEGIAIAEKKDHPGTVASFQKIQLRIAFDCNDTDAVRSIASQLYGGSDMEYYRIIKQTYPTVEWPPIVEEFIQKLQPQGTSNGRFPQPVNINDIAAIFIEEQYWDRLLALLQEHKRLDIVERYAHLLTNNYPAELIDLYSTSLRNFAAQHTGRNHYVTIRNTLQKISKCMGGKENVRKIINDFTHQYKARKALLDELSKIKV